MRCDAEVELVGYGVDVCVRIIPPDPAIYAVEGGAWCLGEGGVYGGEEGLGGAEVGRVGG